MCFWLIQSCLEWLMWSENFLCNSVNLFALRRIQIQDRNVLKNKFQHYPNCKRFNHNITISLRSSISDGSRRHFTYLLIKSLKLLIFEFYCNYVFEKIQIPFIEMVIHIVWLLYITVLCNQPNFRLFIQIYKRIFFLYIWC